MGPKNNRLFRANQWWGRLFSVTKLRSNNYEVVRGIWKSIAVPSLMYGMETIPWTMGEINKMETIQNKIGRLALGGNRFVGTEAIRGEMGWSTFEERIMKSKLRFKIRIERMDENRWVKKVSQSAGSGSRWMRECSKIVEKCGLFKRWNPNGEGINEWCLAYSSGDEGTYDEKEWRTLISAKVKEFGLVKWRRGIEGKQTLARYSLKVAPRRENFYDGSWGSSLLFKARSGALELNDRTYRFNPRNTKECEFGCMVSG